LVAGDYCASLEQELVPGSSRSRQRHRGAVRFEVVGPNGKPQAVAVNLKRVSPRQVGEGRQREGDLARGGRDDLGGDVEHGAWRVGLIERREHQHAVLVADRDAVGVGGGVDPARAALAAGIAAYGADRLSGRNGQRRVPEHVHRVRLRVQIGLADVDVAGLQRRPGRVGEEGEWGYDGRGHYLDSCWGCSETFDS